MKTNKIGFLSAGFIIVSFLFSCQMPVQPEQTGNMEDTPEITNAVCVLQPTEGNNVTGLVTFEKTDNGMHVVAEVKGLSEGLHGFHIHQYGDISASDGTSAGGHFNPDNQPHGAPYDTARHVGDLGNIVAMADDMGTLDVTDTLLTFQGSHSIIGRSVVIHAGEDDLISQPTGNAGARVAYGVIGIAE